MRMAPFEPWLYGDDSANGLGPVRERFYVELAPGNVRLRHQPGMRTKFGRRRLTLLESQVLRALEDTEEDGESIEWGPPDPDQPVTAGAVGPSLSHPVVDRRLN